MQPSSQLDDPYASPLELAKNTRDLPTATPEMARDESAASEWFNSLWAVVAAFGTYFCMYAFRKPFTAATYEDESWQGSL